MKMKMKKKRSRWEDAEASTPSRDGGGSGTDDESLQKRRHVTDGEDQRALVPTEPGIGGVMQAALLRGGSRPVLLHKKKLDECDMNNMLFVKGGERVAEFLREVDGGGKGATVMGVDGGGRVYEKLVMKNWASLKMVVINSDWNKVIKANKAQIGQIMEIWGYTENHKPCLAFNFRVDRLESDHDRSSTTTTTT